MTSVTTGTSRAPLIAGVVIVAVVIGVGGTFVWQRNQGQKPVSQPAAEATTAPKTGHEGMNMSASAPGETKLTPEQVRQFGITFATAEERPLSVELRAVGTVVVDETRAVTVTSKFGGYVEQLFVNVTGQRVQSGQPMAAVYSPELLAAQEELLIAQKLDRSAVDNALPGVTRGNLDMLGAVRRRLRLLDVSDAQIDEVLRTGKAQATTVLLATANGVITEKMVQKGQAIQAGMPLFTITDLSRLWVDVQIRADDAMRVAQGAVATIEPAGSNGRTYTGRVDYIFPTVDAESRTIRARVVVGNADGNLKPGMYATVNLRTPSRTALTIPRSAVIQTGARSVVFIDLGGGRLVPGDVEVGTTRGELVEILAGIEPGQRVVTSAQFMLESESNIAEVMRSMLGMGAMTDMSDHEMPSGVDVKTPKPADLDGKQLVVPPKKPTVRPPGR